MPALYLVCLLLGIGCMLLLDRRFRLFFWSDPVAATIVTAVGVVLFVLWDAAGIASGIFLRGEGPIATGILLAPEFPVEEPVFLLFLVLCTMVLFSGSRRIVTRFARGAGRRGDGRVRDGEGGR